MTETALKRSRSGSRTRQTRPLSVHLTETERAALAEAADRAALPLSGYVRTVLLKAPPPRQVRRPPLERQQLAQLVGQLGRVGNNLNQLTKLANEGRIVPPQTLGLALDDVRRALALIARAMGHDY